jgi:ABC-type branched-subunit amino acid transport system ATPase component/predicted MFS family arabinose efflux permease
VTDEEAASGAGEHIAALAASVIDEESTASAPGPDPEVLAAEAAVLAAGEERLTLRDALQVGGRRTLVLVAALSAVQLMDGRVFNVLAPDIQDSLGVSDTVLGVLGGATGVLFVLGAIPLSSLSDKTARKNLLAWSMSIWAVVLACTGLVQNALQMFVARLGAGLGEASSLPVSTPLLMDAYPISARGRIFAVLGGTQAVGSAVSPFLAGGLAALGSGDEGWRLPFLVVGLAGIVVALLVFTIPEPRRGRHEMRSVLGEELPPDEDELPISLSVAFERLRKIQTFHYLLVGMAALGFGLFAAPLFLNLYFDDELGLSAFERGLVASVVAVPTLITIAVVGRRVDRVFRDSPQSAMASIGVLVMVFGVSLTIAVNLPNLYAVIPVLAIGTAAAQTAFVIFPAVISTVIPYRLRARGTTMIGLYVFLGGGFLGSVLAGMLSDAYGTRTALVVLVLPSTLIGGSLIALGARHIRQDMAMVVEELQEEQAERARRATAGAVTPVLQVRNLDFSYGRVQILFDVSLDVHEGETLALLGTNGAGKSTLLRVISGLGVPERGVIRLRGRTITYAEPELRAQIGIVQLVGGGAVFPPLTVEENLRTGAFLYEKADQDRRIERSVALFPSLADRLGMPARDLSGGQQQMLALAMTLLHEPEVLIIDELSLGLAPIVVDEVLGVIQRLRAAGQTMVIVEQSLNVALAIADRAVFMEKGHVRFTGDAEDLRHRDDLVRAVFLGATS